jgi:hypothetical protein
MALRQTHTHAILEISPGAYAEIADKLRAAGYGHAFSGDDTGEVVSMQGIALKALACSPYSENLLEISEELFDPPTWAARQIIKGGRPDMSNADAIEMLRRIVADAIAASRTNLKP